MPANRLNREYDERIYVFVLTIILIIIGCLYIYNVGSIQAQRWDKPDYYYLVRQFIAVLLGMVLMILAYNIPINFYRKVVPVLYFVTLFLLMSVFFFSAVNGSHRWIKLPFINFQPSELAKFVSIVYLAHYLDKKSDKISDFFKGFLPAMILLGILSALILVEPDYGTSFLIMAISIILMFIGGASIKHILGIVAFSVPPAIVLLFSGYHRERLLSFLDPWSYYHGPGYQLIQSLIAIGSGGFFGKGFGNSSQKLYFLPEAHTDFIFSIISEELGFLGSLILLFIILMLFLEIKRVADSESDKFKRLLCFGIGLMFMLQALIHLFVSTGLFPTKGIALPFISYGGSSVMMSLFMIGIVLRCKKEQL
ncbi:cell division protein FtsW [Deferribacter desulfuricans SSM1]|uniref:Probable peptidoglycan glycosyltransferase FtsW n=1 Tax=Deferribacter desulfuricans (strain DSM 14783 / JCM 11476 / NBRC 101012 / SSM1) TaxID=639282 RepID=D3PBV4_DEFDS|nr:putative lipid II flippase FtsW [Deferribacter desulfuricans]BAI80077.1 cell division protein FtsW [Deferribacter desulfuricans SSM1]